MRKGFTLIELLVVISIIGLLSSLVLVSMKDSMESARIGASKQFSANIYHAQGAEMIGYWDFNEASGTNVPDVSGNNYPGAVATGYSALFNSDSLNGKAFFSNSATYSIIKSSNVAKMVSGSGTLELWIKILKNPPDMVIPFFYVTDSGCDNCVQPAFFNTTWSGNGRWSFYMREYDSAGVYQGVSCTFSYTNANPNFGKWNHVAFSFKGGEYSDQSLFYLNGKEIDPSTISCDGGIYLHSVGPVITHIMAYINNIAIDEVRFYDKPITTSQIKMHYAEGLYKHQLADIKKYEFE